jgi:hypothetical protein
MMVALCGVCVLVNVIMWRDGSMCMRGDGCDAMTGCGVVGWDRMWYAPDDDLAQMEASFKVMHVRRMR